MQDTQREKERADQLGKRVCPILLVHKNKNVAFLFCFDVVAFGITILIVFCPSRKKREQYRTTSRVWWQAQELFAVHEEDIRVVLKSEDFTRTLMKQRRQHASSQGQGMPKNE